jgi:hypothetical protein
MNETISEDDVATQPGKWQCQFCLKSYQPTYRYKTHLQRCLVYCDRTDGQLDLISNMIVELKRELKAEIKEEFLNMLKDVKTDVSNDVKTDVSNDVKTDVIKEHVIIHKYAKENYSQLLRHMF